MPGPVQPQHGNGAWAGCETGGEEVLLHPGQGHTSDKFSQNSRNFAPAGKPR